MTYATNSKMFNDKSNNFYRILLGMPIRTLILVNTATYNSARIATDQFSRIVLCLLECSAYLFVSDGRSSNP